MTFDDILQVRGWRRIQRESTEKAVSSDEKLRQEVFEAELNRIDGSRVWTELWMAPGLSPDSGQIQFYIMDISSLRQVEAERLRLATAVEQAPDYSHALEFSPDGRLLAVAANQGVKFYELADG